MKREMELKKERERQQLEDMARQAEERCGASCSDSAHVMMLHSFVDVRTWVFQKID